MEYFIEIQQWGWNALTITAVLNVAFALIRAHGYIFLIEHIWRQRSVRQVETSLYMLVSIVGLIMLPYGYAQQELVLVINGALLIVAALPVVLGAWRYGSDNRWLFALFVVGGIATLPAWYLPLPLLSSIFVLANLFTFIPMVRQGWRLWREHDVGVIPVQMLWWILAGSGLWFVYGMLVADAPLSSLAALQIVIVSATIIVWYKVRAGMRT